MALLENIAVSILPDLRAFLKAQLTSGRHGNVGEVFRAAARLLERDEAGLIRRPSVAARSGRAP